MSRSLKVASNQTEQVKLAYRRSSFPSQQALATELGKSADTIRKFFNGKPIDRLNFIEICEKLGLQWEVVSRLDHATNTRQAATQATPLIEDVVNSIRCQLRFNIQEKCSTMRILDMTQPIALTGERGIYTKVNILKKVLGRRRLGISELLQTTNFENVDRFGLSRVIEERIPGLSVVRHNSKLIVLGKPGAGKTTFLKYLAMHCSEDQAGEESLLSDHVPLFITLKDFAEAPGKPGLALYIAHQLSNFSISDAENKTEQLLRDGKVLLLLDGLDEVRENDIQHVLWEVKEFVDQFSDNKFVITCRIATLEYTFQNFVEVEISDFDNEQIAAFIYNWFRCRNSIGYQQDAKLMLDKLEANSPIKELASNPLLLTLLCLEFEESLDFPLNRSELYERGLRVLLSKWDASRRIERDQVYKRLSLKRKEDLLSQLAFITYEKASYFFKQRVIENHIADYIGNLPDAYTDPDTLLLDSEAVLRSIEAQHGLLLERAKGIYSFSHLTFQEYFTAKRIVGSSSTQALDHLAHYITEVRWREVFLLTVGMLQNADHLLRQIKRQIDNSVADDTALQNFLSRINDESPLATTSSQQIALRGFYFYRSLALAYDIAANSACKRACNYAQKLTLALDKKFDLDLTLSNDFFILRRLNSALDIVSRLNFALSLIQNTDIDLILIQSRRLTHELVFNLAYTLRRANSPELSQLLKSACNQLPNPDGNCRSILDWWRKNGQVWAEQITQFMLSYCKIDHDWQFTSEQVSSLEQFLGANLLLVECLNSECYVSRSVREEIEATLLLPIKTIN